MFTLVHRYFGMKARPSKENNLTSSNIQFVVNRKNLRDSKFVEATVEHAKKTGTVIVRIDRFAFTSNSVLYGVLGERNKYWELFPASGDNRIIPVWGLGEVVESNGSDISVGEKLYGFFPMAQFVTLEPADITNSGFRDAAAHRQNLAITYNSYLRVTNNPSFIGETGDLEALFRPLTITAFVAACFFAEERFFGAKQVVISSASAKTALSLAYLLRTYHPDILVTGLTSPKNVPFVQSMGLYNSVVTYDQLSTLSSSEASIFFDVAGNADVRLKIHQHFGDMLKHSARVGLAHWEATQSNEVLPGPKHELLFAPHLIDRFSAEWGADEFNRRFKSAHPDLLSALGNGIKIVRNKDRDEAQSIYLKYLSGNFSPDTGYILSLQ